VQKNYHQCLPRNRNEVPEIHARLVQADDNSHSLTVTDGQDHRLSCKA
jgi:hypothetical protein